MRRIVACSAYTSFGVKLMQDGVHLVRQELNELSELRWQKRSHRDAEPTWYSVQDGIQHIGALSRRSPCGHPSFSQVPSTTGMPTWDLWMATTDRTSTISAIDNMNVHIGLEVNNARVEPHHRINNINSVPIPPSLYFCSTSFQHHQQMT